jgi:copper(I)-binding protein
MIVRTLAAALATMTLAAGAHAQTVVDVQSAWVRPADVGQAATPLYVDVTASAPLRLVGAASDMAKSARLMTTGVIDGREVASPVRSLDVPAGTRFRLAPRGPFVELRDVRQVLRTGVDVPFTLEFTAADGKTVRASGTAVVRGLMPKPDEYETAPDAK